MASTESVVRKRQRAALKRLEQLAQSNKKPALMKSNKMKQQLSRKLKSIEKTFSKLQSDIADLKRIAGLNGGDSI